jgi:transcriptional regulator of acetoin/glycerol metabolism
VDRDKSHSSNESSKQAQRVRTAREQFLAGRGIGIGDVRPIVQDSWLRCRTHQVDPGSKAAPIVLSQRQAEDLRKDSLLCKAAAPVLHLLKEVLEDHRYLLLLSDSSCRPLEIAGNSQALDGAERINVVFGSQWCEAQVGTDALAVSSFLDAPVQIHWSEHYCEQIGDNWAGSAAPIHDPITNQTLGILSIYGYDELAHPRALELVIDSAALIKRRLNEDELTLRLFLFERYGVHQDNFLRDNLLCIDRKGTILSSSPGTLTLLGLSPNQTGRLISQLPELSPLQSFVGRESYDSSYDLEIQTKLGSDLKSTLLPVKKDSRLAGFIVSFSAKTPKGERVQLGSSWRAAHTFDDVVGETDSLAGCVVDAKNASRQDFPVLICGESGTGKELFAQSIHNASERRQNPFIPINCGAMSDELLSAELFGYVEGAFTGAVRGGKPGKLELSHTGTIFFDEVEDMSPKMQAHLLRVLEEQRVVRIGAERPRSIDVRVIAASNVDLEARVREGRFRLDLYYRLNVMTLLLPPLRNRKSDIPILSRHILVSQARPMQITAEALQYLENYDWPGNVRQLRNTLLQAASRAVDPTITEADLPPNIRSHDRKADVSFPAETGSATGSSLQAAEKLALIRTLRECQGNISRAALQLRLHRATLYRLLKKHCVTPERIWQ